MTSTAGSIEPSLISVRNFLYLEAHLLDSRRFDEWMELFTNDGVYWAPAKPQQKNPEHHISLIYDDREFMRNRIKRLHHPKIHSQIPPSRAIRFISNIRLAEPNVENIIQVSSNLLVAANRPVVGERTTQFYTGWVQHTLVRSEDDFLIKEKKVELTNCDDTFDSIFFYF